MYMYFIDIECFNWYMYFIDIEFIIDICISLILSDCYRETRNSSIFYLISNEGLLNNVTVLCPHKKISILERHHHDRNTIKDLSLTPIAYQGSIPERFWSFYILYGSFCQYKLLALKPVLLIIQHLKWHSAAKNPINYISIILIFIPSYLPYLQSSFPEVFCPGSMQHIVVRSRMESQIQI